MVLMCGAGVSVSAGIPDFRTPGTGLYSNLESKNFFVSLIVSLIVLRVACVPEYNLPTAESVFTLDYFRENPAPFNMLAAEMFPGRHKPTKTHAFMRLLQDKGKLMRCYSQNIDTLERVAGVSPSRLVEAHGSFGDVMCIEKDCGRRFRLQDYRDRIEAGETPRCATELDIPPPPLPPTQEEIEEAFALVQERELSSELAKKDFDWNRMVDTGVALKRAEDQHQKFKSAAAQYPKLLADWESKPKHRICGGLVKSKIVFFGEPVALGETSDLEEAELLIIMGTSLQVMPFAGIIGNVSPLCPRLLMNRELVGTPDQEGVLFFPTDAGLRVGMENNYRDVFCEGDCDHSVEEICRDLGWDKALSRRYQEMQARDASSAWQDLVDHQATKISENPDCLGVFM